MSKISSILGPWTALMTGLQSESMEKAFEEMQKPVEERIEKRKKEIAENKIFFDSLDTFLKEEDKSVFDVEGIEKLIEDIISAPNFDNVTKPDTLEEKIELVKNRTHNIIQLNELLLTMEEDELKRQ